MTDFILQNVIRSRDQKRNNKINYSKHGMQFFVCKCLSETGIMLLRNGPNFEDFKRISLQINIHHDRRPFFYGTGSGLITDLGVLLQI